MSLSPGNPRQGLSQAPQSGETVRASAAAAPEGCPLADLGASPRGNSVEQPIGSTNALRELVDICPAGAVLRGSEEQYRLLFECNPVPMWVFDPKTLHFVAVNEAAIRQYGFSREEFLTKTVLDIRPEEDVPEMLRDIANHTTGLQKRGFWRHRRKSGEILDVEIICDYLDFNGVESILVAAHDVTERKRAEDALRQAEEKFRGIFEDAVIGIFQAAPDGRLLSVNRAHAQMHGYESPEEMIAEVSNVAWDLFVDHNQIVELGHGVMRHGTVRGAEVEIYRKDRSKKWVRLNVRAIHDAADNVESFEGTVEDITEQKAAQERMKFLAFYDALTELPHRALLQDRLENALSGARRRGEKIALLFLDLDRFKAINDSYGHAFGDTVLQEVAKRLKECVREHTVARVGGDEFLILLSNLKDTSDAAIAANRVVEAMNDSFTVQGRTLTVGCSVGVSIFPEHGQDGDTLIRNADAAMYSAKESGRNSVHYFTDEMNVQAMERLAMDKNLRQALERKEFFLVYQPQMEIASGKITGFEALLRWNHPELGLIPPDRFISIAESNGLILPIGEWVLRAACMQARRWRDQGLCAVPVAVNVSAVQFRQENFGELIQRILRDTDLSPEYLQLELTESVLLSNADRTLSVLREFKEMGLKLSIDDFGTGYSSFTYLKHFSVDKLKIDRSFVRDVIVDRDDAAITIAIISLAKSLNIKVIAEGVENEAQMFFLQEHRCDEIQGHYFSKPVSADGAAAMLQCGRGFRAAGERRISALDALDGLGYAAAE
jgi:diguanylate cyclase (GGDEF)-like protein/PAS domain S-box-containing protein